MTARYRDDGLRAWKQNNQGGRTYFFYDGDTVIYEIKTSPSAATVSRSYGYGANGLVQRFYPDAPIGSQYLLFTFDPWGNLVQRHRQQDTVPADTAVYDSLGLLYLDLSTNAQQPGTPYPLLDPVGGQGQWGVYTDEELRQGAVGTEVGLAGARYYAGSLGRFLMRGSGGINEYEAGGNNPTGGILNGIQLVVDTAGLVPFLNVPAELVSGGISAVQGDWVAVGLSVAGLIPYAGDASVIAKIARRGGKVAKEAEVAEKLAKAGEDLYVGTYINSGGTVPV